MELLRTVSDGGTATAAAIPADMMDWNQEWRGPLRDALDWLRDDDRPPL